MATIKDPVFIMGWPDFGFTIGKPINEVMIKGAKICAADPLAFSQESHKQWRGPFDAMHALGFAVLDTKPKLGGGDTVFLRDKYGYIDENAVVLGRMAGLDRRIEPEEMYRILKRKFICELENPKSFFEGGDLLATPFDVIPIAWGPRTTWAAIEEIKGMFPNKNFLPLEINDHHFDGTQESLVKAKRIHGDTGAVCLPQGDLIIYREGFIKKDADAAERLALDHGRDVYRLTEKQATMMATNIKPWTGAKLFVPHEAEEEITRPKRRLRGAQIIHGESLSAWLKDRGYEPLAHTCSNFKLADGAWNCLINEAARHMLTPEAEQMLQRQTIDWQASHAMTPAVA